MKASTECLLRRRKRTFSVGSRKCPFCAKSDLVVRFLRVQTEAWKLLVDKRAVEVIRAFG